MTAERMPLSIFKVRRAHHAILPLLLTTDLPALLTDFYPLLVANEASIEHVQQTLLKNLYPSMSHSLSGKQQQMIQIPDVRVPPTVELDYWTRE